jgi:YHS domain-containing protein
MRSHNLQLAVALAAMFVPRAATAQHEAHQGSASQASAEMMQCAQVQPVVDSVITGAMTRLESARQSNSPANMRAAVDQLGAALRDIRAQLAPCSAAAADSSPGHAMPGMQPSPGAPASGAPMDHSKMPMGSAPAGKPGASAGAKPAAPMDHSKMPMGSDAQPGKAMDPVTGLMVDPATAPKTTYHGQTYYFSSEQARKEFLENPAKFAKKPKG